MEPPRKWLDETFQKQEEEEEEKKILSGVFSNL